MVYRGSRGVIFFEIADGKVFTTVFLMVYLRFRFAWNPVTKLLSCWVLRSAEHWDFSSWWSIPSSFLQSLSHCYYLDVKMQELHWNAYVLYVLLILIYKVKKNWLTFKKINQPLNMTLHNKNYCILDHLRLSIDCVWNNQSLI